MSGWPVMPGVPAAGHVTRSGAWHPGAEHTCRRRPCYVPHEIIVDGPIRYPGGKDGSYQARCRAGDYTSDFGTEAEVRRSGEQHVEAKR